MGIKFQKALLFKVNMLTLLLQAFLIDMGWSAKQYLTITSLLHFSINNYENIIKTQNKHDDKRQ